MFSELVEPIPPYLIGLMAEHQDHVLCVLGDDAMIAEWQGKLTEAKKSLLLRAFVVYEPVLPTGSKSWNRAAIIPTIRAERSDVDI